MPCREIGAWGRVLDVGGGGGSWLSEGIVTRRAAEQTGKPGPTASLASDDHSVYGASLARGGSG